MALLRMNFLLLSFHEPMIKLKQTKLKVADMTQLVASTYLGKGVLYIYLDGQIIMKDCDNITLDLKENTDYVLHWFVDSVAGTSFSITISSPREAQFQLTRVLKNSGKDFGGFTFKT